MIRHAWTVWKKDLGALHNPMRIGTREKLLAISIGSHDGLFGPGTSSILIFLLIGCFAFDFLHALASAKLVNIATNVAALMVVDPALTTRYAEIAFNAGRLDASMVLDTQDYLAIARPRLVDISRTE